MYTEINNTPRKQDLFFRVSEKDTDDEDAIYLEVRKAIRAAEVGAAQTAGDESSSNESSSVNAAGGEAVCSPRASCDEKFKNANSSQKDHDATQMHLFKVSIQTRGSRVEVLERILTN